MDRRSEKTAKKILIHAYGVIWNEVAVGTKHNISFVLKADELVREGSEKVL